MRTSFAAFALALAAAAAALALVAQPADGASAWTTRVTGLTRPVGIKHSGDGTGRLFIIEQHTALVRIFNTATNTLLATPFLNLKALASVSTGGEGGLLGIAFHPNFKQNGHFYLSYTREDLTSVLVRYTVAAGNPNIANTASALIILTVPQPFANHNGGDIEFGNDGFLYYSLGDGGSANDPNGNGQNRNTLLGKILRIDVNSASGGKNYAVPASNVIGNENFVYGLRNPWRFSFDRLTGDLWIGDVGQGQFEEIDFKKANASKLFTTNGDNFGWNIKEGNSTFAGGTPATPLTDPVIVYSHANGRCSVTGGFVFRGKGIPELYGTYFYGDYCSGEIFQFKNGASTLNLDGPTGLTTFGEDEDGGLYHCLQSGSCLQLLSTDNRAPKLAAVFSLLDRNGGSLFPGDEVNITIVVTNTGNATQPNNPEREFNLTFPIGYMGVRRRIASSGIFSRNKRRNFFWWNGSLAAGQSVTLQIVARARRPGTFCFSGKTAFDKDLIFSNTANATMTGQLCYTISSPPT